MNSIRFLKKRRIKFPVLKHLERRTEKEEKADNTNENNINK